MNTHSPKDDEIARLKEEITQLKRKLAKYEKVEELETYADMAQKLAELDENIDGLVAMAAQLSDDDHDPNITFFTGQVVDQQQFVEDIKKIKEKLERERG